MNAPLPHKLGLVSTDEDLFEICRQQAAALKVTYGTLERYCGFTDSYWSKKLAHCSYAASGKRSAKRGWSAEAFQAAMPAFCFKLIAVHDPEAEAKLRAFMAKHFDREADPHSPLLSAASYKPIIIKLSRRHMKKLGRKGGKARLTKMTKRQRSRQARKAVLVRWRKPKIVDISNSPIGKDILAEQE